jgi:hypothetical protein
MGRLHTQLPFKARNRNRLRSHTMPYTTYETRVRVPLVVTAHNFVKSHRSRTLAGPMRDGLCDGQEVSDMPT